MHLDIDLASKALLKSLIASPLLVTDLPEAVAFTHSALHLPDHFPPLDLQQKLGHLYEDALAVLIEASPLYDLLARNLQIQSDTHTTVGELDFLLRDLRSGQLVHLELATKFYLAVQTESGLALPGPDARDNYFKKLHRLRTHQLLLPTSHQQHLPTAYRHEPIITQQLIFGCLFDHIASNKPATAEFISATCRRGRWLTIDQLPDQFPPDTTYQIIPKPLWPVPLELLIGIPLERWSPTASLDRCLMLRIRNEPLPYFIAPADYEKRLT
jgi:hypothetical protein